MAWERKMIASLLVLILVGLIVVHPHDRRANLVPTARLDKASVEYVGISLDARHNWHFRLGGRSFGLIQSRRTNWTFCMLGGHYFWTPLPADGVLAVPILPILIAGCMIGFAK